MDTETNSTTRPDIEELESNLRKLKKLGKNRGVETLLRNTYRVHIALNTLADSKANFLITVNSALMILASSHGMTYVHNRLLLIPIVVIVLTCIGSMALAVLCARPRVDHEAYKRQADGTTRGNLLFFGSFCKLSGPEFNQEMLDVLHDREQVYSVMLSDLYQMGKVLDRKYARLKTAYAILMLGLPIGVVLFVILQGALQHATPA
jgi:hypothetical protein